MKFLFFLKIVSLLIIVSSCAKIDVVGIDKDKKIRTVSYFYKDTKIKLLNQKYSTEYSGWFDAKCSNSNYDFLKCPKDEIVFTKNGISRIQQAKISQRGDANTFNDKSESSEKESESSEEESESSEEESESSEEESESSEEESESSEEESESFEQKLIGG